MSSTRHTTHSSARRLGPGFAFSLVCHLCAVLIFGPQLTDCGGGDLATVEALDDGRVLADDEEALQIFDEVVEEAKTPPELAENVPVPEQTPKEIDTFEPQKPEEKPEEPRKTKLKEEGNLIVDQPLVDKESEPPPDTNTLGPQDRRVIQEVQPKRTALEASQKPPDPQEKREFTEKADDKPDKPEAAAEKPSETPKGEETEKPKEPKEASRIKTDSKREAPEDPSKARQRQKKGDPGTKVASKVAPKGAEVPVDDKSTAPADGSPKEDEGDEAGEDKAGEAGEGAQFDVAAAMRIAPGAYDKMFGERDARDLKRVTASEKRMLGKWQKRVAATQAALQNFVPNVRYGNHIAINTRKSEYAVYIAAMHRKIHRLWGINYLRHLDVHYGMGHPLSNPRLSATIEYVIDGKSGELREANIVETSGQLEFDAEAIRIGHAVTPNPKAPDAIVSPDGNVYLHWRFRRDTRQCGTFGVSLYVLDNAGRINTYRPEGQLDDLNKHRHNHGRAVDPSLISKPTREVPALKKPPVDDKAPPEKPKDPPKGPQ